MEHNPLWEADIHWAGQEIPHFYGTQRFITPLPGYNAVGYTMDSDILRVFLPPHFI
jgi:hypothetical protein